MVGRLRSLRCDLIEHGSASSFTELGFRMEVLRVRRCLPSHRGIRDSLGSARQRKAMTLAHGIKVSILNPLVGSGGRGPATSALPRSARSGRCPTAISQVSPGVNEQIVCHDAQTQCTAVLRPKYDPGRLVGIVRD
jgi:hypothetical protein